jgi:PAS domain S-box-containing protein
MAVASAELLILLMPLAAVAALLLGRQQQRLAVLKRESARIRRAANELQAVFDRTPLGLAVFDTDLRYVHINRLLADINGVPVDEHVGKTVRQMVPEVRDGVEQRLRSVLRSGLPITGHVHEASTAAQPGVLRTFRETMVPLFDGDGQLHGVMVSVEDITEQQRLAGSLRQSQQREQRRTRELDGLLQACPAGLVIAVDRSCEHARGNEAAERLLRLQRGQNPALGATHGPAVVVLADGRPLAPDELPLQRAAATGDATWGALLAVRFAGGDEIRVVVNALLFPAGLGSLM